MAGHSGKRISLILGVVLVHLAGLGAGMAQPSAPVPPAAPVATVGKGKYVEPILQPLVFKFDDLGMIEAERRQYAENMAAFALAAVEKHADGEGNLGEVSPATYQLARKLVGLALHLDPRSRSAVIANGRLKAGVVPRRGVSPSMAAETFSSLLVGRAAELRKAGGADNLLLAGCFLDLATALDPANDDAIYAFETFKMDGQKVSWTGILGGE
jgi:hypothetical protein